MSGETTGYNIRCSDIKAGDILLFHGTKHGLDAFIRWITVSDVSHAALCVQEGDSIVVAEETSAGVQKNLIGDDMGKRQYAYVNRLIHDVDMAPVCNTTNNYMNQPFAYGQIILLLCLLLFRELPLGPRILSILYKIIEVVLAYYIDKIDNELFPGKTPMVCSEFVYVCFSDTAASEDNLQYRLQVYNEFDYRKPESLFELVNDYCRINPDNIITRNPVPELKVNPVCKIDDLDNLCNELMNEIRDGSSSEKTGAKDIVDDRLMMLVHRAGYIMCKLFFSSDERFKTTEYPKSLAVLDEIKKYFITPEDLLERCKDATCVGIAGQDAPVTESVSV